jgi:hypothetical protein
MTGSPKQSRKSSLRQVCLIAMTAALVLMPKPGVSQVLPAPTPEVAQFLSETEHLEYLALRLANAADGKCANRWRHPGLTTHSRDDYPPALRRHVRRFAERSPTVRSVDAPALFNKVQPGDQLIGPDRKPLRADSQTLQAQLALGRMTVARGREVFNVTHDAPQICYRPVQVGRSIDVEARTEANRIVVSQGLLRFVKSEDELAFVIAHELSHFMLGHPQRLSAARRDRTLTASLRRQLETEADQAAIYLLYRAGLDPIAGRRFHERSSLLRDIPLLGFSSHPTRSDRIRDIDTALGHLDPQIGSVAEFIQQIAVR